MTGENGGRWQARCRSLHIEEMEGGDGVDRCTQRRWKEDTASITAHRGDGRSRRRQSLHTEEMKGGDDIDRCTQRGWKEETVSIGDDG